MTSRHWTSRCVHVEIIGTTGQQRVGGTTRRSKNRVVFMGATKHQDRYTKKTVKMNEENPYDVNRTGNGEEVHKYI